MTCFLQIYIYGGVQSITLYSKYTCLYSKNSGEGKSLFYSHVSTGVSLGEVEVTNSENYSFYMAEDIDGVRAVANLPERNLVIIDEVALTSQSVIDMLSKSSNLYICICRSMPFKLYFPMIGMYELDTEDSYAYISKIKHLRVVKAIKYNHVIVESCFNRSEGELLSSLGVQIIASNGSGNIRKKAKRLQGNILIFVDMGNIGVIYSFLKELEEENSRVYFYPYQSFEELIVMSSLVEGINKQYDKDNFDFLSIERYYEKLLEYKTLGLAGLEYKHKKQLPTRVLQEGINLLAGNKVGVKLLQLLNSHLLPLL